VHTLYRAFLCTVLLPVLGMPILYGLLSHQTVGIACIIIIIIISIIIIIIINTFIFLSHLEILGKGTRLSVWVPVVAQLVDCCSLEVGVQFSSFT